MIKKFYSLLIFLTTLAAIAKAQNFEVNKIEPPNWWSGMKLNKIQLMVYGKNLDGISASFTDEKIKVLKIHSAESSSYSFIDIEIPNILKPGNYKLNISKGVSSVSINFPVYKKLNTAGNFKGFTQKDVIYLILPDRFADGDTANNNFPGMPDKCNLKNPIDRHGGDIQGIINHLDYLKNLGVTALWISPLVENNTEKHLYAYAGYSATNLYKIDPRFGTDELYKKLVKDAHTLGLKIILDHVSNHISVSHPWMKDLPFHDWINGTVNHHLATNHDKLAFADIHRDSSTIFINTHGWFTDYLPDLNQANPYLANYLIENTIWWIESTGVDGIREDTYPYSDQQYLARWAKTILEEFPNLNIVGEVWTGDAVFLSTFQRNNCYPKMTNTNLPAVTDYALYDCITAFLKGKTGLGPIYEDFAKDFIFPDPDNLVTFIDNHDVVRALLQADGNVNKYKMALTLLLTSRGIPALFYGTEIGIEGGNSNDLARADFPGGFPGDKENAFTQSGRTEKENDIYNYVHNLLLLRSEHKSLSEGRLIQFPPSHETYVYFKSYGDEKMMIVLNNNRTDEEMGLSPFKDQLTGYTQIKNLSSGKVSKLDANTIIKLDDESANIFQLNKN